MDRAKAFGLYELICIVRRSYTPSLYGCFLTAAVLVPANFLSSFIARRGSPIIIGKPDLGSRVHKSLCSGCLQS